jgi:hypothetical protein
MTMGGQDDKETVAPEGRFPILSPRAGRRPTRGLFPILSPRTLERSERARGLFIIEVKFQSTRKVKGRILVNQ